MSDPIICDTSIWLYTGRIGQARLLSQLYNPVYTTEIVCQELDIGRYSRPETIDPRHLPWVTIVQADSGDIAALPTNRLGPGEQSVLAFAQSHNIFIVSLDDRQARDLAHQIGLRVIGTVGLLLKSKEAGLVSAAQPLLKKLQDEGFYISEDLIKFALQRAKEEY